MITPATPYSITYIGSEPIKAMQTVQKTIDSGQSFGYLVEFSDSDEKILLNYICWDNSGAEVKAEIVDGNNRLLERLKHGLRLGIQALPNDPEKSYARVRMAKLKGEVWSGVYKCTLRELGEPFGDSFDLKAFLENRQISIAKASRLEAQIGSKTTDDLYAVFATEDYEHAIHLYVISRILPILKKVMASRQMKLF